MIDSYNGILYPLTHPQKRIWYIEKINPGTSLYNIGGPIRIKGKIDFNLLEESINIFIKNNEGLRLRLIEENGEAKQYISKFERIKLDFIDFSVFKDPEEEFKKWVEKEAKKPFKLENERLFYFAMFRISENDNGYFAKFHHIISDGWSINIMTNQICDNYMKLLKGEKINENLEPSYIEYISNEEKYLSSDRFLKNKFFWNEKFKVLPEAFLYKGLYVIKGKRKTFEIDSELSNKIKKFASDNKFSLNTFFITLYLIYLYKTTLQTDIVIGTPVLNRSGKKEKSIFGMFTSTMPFRFAIDDNMNVIETMSKVNGQLMECYFNQKYPYDLLVQDLNLKKRGYDSLFNTCVNYYNTKLNTELNGFPVENVEFYNGNQIYSMQLVIKDWSDSGNLTLDIDYKVSDYSDEQIEDMYTRLISLANYIIINPYEKLNRLSLLSIVEREKLLYDLNATESDYPKYKMIHQLFEEQAEKTPDKVAICFNNIDLTYKQLNEKANQLARYLVRNGVKRETIVGLLTTHSLETVIGILGILKAGGAYLPIDPGYPGDRISYMLKNSGSRILLTNIEVPESVNFNGKIINLNNKDIYLENSDNIECVSKYNCLAYIIYTSGSTGKPKGVMIEHQALVNYIWWARKMYIKNENEVFPLYSSLAFDLTVTSIFTPLISGNKIIVYNDNSNDEYVLYRIMKENKVTVIKLTPSHLSLLKDMDNRNSTVRRFIVGGEDLKVNLAKAIYDSFGGNVEIYNEYGPTETTVGCMIHKYDYENDTNVSVPIGVPADNVQIYILDRNLEPVPVNSIGEIYISGDGVARGYLNEPELTREKFIENPFINGKSMYKTGDLAKYLSNGKIMFVGRADRQVKISGYRIEIGEIEKCLLSHEAIEDAVVIDFENENNNKYLCAYIVEKSRVSTHELIGFLKKYLPDYMIPVHFFKLDKIPLTINGKLDKEQLPKPEVVKGDFIAYRDEKEKDLVNVICDVLNIETVSIKDNFYYLGGDSIKAIQIASKLNNKGYKIKVKDILSYPVIEEMALHVEYDKKLAVIQKPCEGRIKLTPIVSWFISQKLENPNYYNQSVLLELDQDIRIEELEIIFNKLIKHHDSLRINFKLDTCELFYNSDHLKKNYHIEKYDLRNLSYTEQCNIMHQISERIKASFNIENDILIKASIFDLGENHGLKMLITAHHLVVDGISWRIIIDDINTMLRQLKDKQAISLPVKTHSYYEWAEALYSYSARISDEEKKYWDSIINKDFDFPIDHDLGEDIIEHAQTISSQLTEDETESLMTIANNSYKTEPRDLLITALLKTIKEFSGSNEIIIDIEGHGREEIFDELDITRTVGWFTSLYPFYINIEGSDLSSFIKDVKEKLRKIPNNGIGFGILKYISKSLDDSNKRKVKFNYLGDFSDDFGTDNLKLINKHLEVDSYKSNHLSHILEITCYKLSNKFEILLTYSKNKFLERTMEKFINCYTDNLKNIIDHCKKDIVDFTLSDFDTVKISQRELESLFS